MQIWQPYERKTRKNKGERDHAPFHVPGSCNNVIENVSVERVNGPCK